LGALFRAVSNNSAGEPENTIPPDAAARAFTLISGLLILCLSNGRWLVPIAIWIGPALVLRALRGLSIAPAVGFGLLGFMGVFIVQSLGVLNMPPPLSYVIGALIGAIGFIPYAIDRLAAQSLRGLSATLVFPLALCCVEFATTRLSPYGSFGVIAYAQPDNLPLLQLLSVTGLWGVSFLIAWFASVANLVWEHRSNLRAARIAVITFGAVFLVVIALGQARLALGPQTQTVRIASITASSADNIHFLDYAGLPCTTGQCDSGREQAARIQDELLNFSRREAMAGARAILWSEDSGIGFKSDEDAFIARGQELARDQNVTLVMALQTLTPSVALVENKTVTIDQHGKIAAIYEKARPVPGDPDKPGDGRIFVVPTDFGRLATAICFDLDFPALIRQVGRARADILFVPASDWREIDPLHARMAVFRGIENGVSVVRQTRRGLSLATDPYGRQLAQMDFFRTRSRALIANVPVRGVATLYAIWGDLFDWLGIVGLVVLLALGVTFGKMRSRT
jgi:apolipoprotein N-acyltransferase